MATPSEPNGQKPPPRCKAILLCDQVIIDAVTKKHSIIGIFDRISAHQYPATIQPCYAFVQLVDGIGECDLRAEIHDLREDTILARLPPIRIPFPPRTNCANVIMGVVGLPLPHDGVYDFVVFAGDDVIDRQRFEACLLGEQADGEGHSPESDGDGQ